ncbi:hypothetical protein GE21DRAFT_1346179, partial [Neurospora crassa]
TLQYPSSANPGTQQTQLPVFLDRTRAFVPSIRKIDQKVSSFAERRSTEKAKLQSQLGVLNWTYQMRSMVPSLSPRYLYVGSMLSLLLYQQSSELGLGTLFLRRARHYLTKANLSEVWIPTYLPKDMVGPLPPSQLLYPLVNFEPLLPENDDDRLDETRLQVYSSMSANRIK